MAGNPGNVIVPVYAFDAPLRVKVPQLPAGSAEARELLVAGQVAAVDALLDGPDAAR